MHVIGPVGSTSAVLFTGPVRLMERDSTRAPDDELVVLAQKGNRRAFDDLMERHKQKAFRVAFDFTRDREEARDLSQEAFLRAYSRLESFDGRSGFYTWFYRILVNLCLDSKRRAKHRAAEPFDEGVETRLESTAVVEQPETPDQHAMATQVSRKIGAALEALPPRQRTAFTLKNHQGLSIKEIAALMDSAEGTVKVHLHRAVTALRKHLAEFA